MKCIVNIAAGSKESWYFRGQERLKESLQKYNSNTKLLFFKYHDFNKPYQLKVESILNAVTLGYKQILYLDCSIMALQPIDKLWDIINEKGYYLYESGMNCAQTSNDRSLELFGLNRDTVELFKEAATNVIGINTEHWLGQKMIAELQMSYIPEAINGIKWPNEIQRLNESKDKRFKFHRQDQTVISLIAGKYNMEIFENEFVWRDESDNKQNAKHLFRLKGGY